MAPPPPPPPSQTSQLDPELLLAQSDWVQSLARRLVGNADEAEDVAQTTMLAALERPPHNATNERSLRAWLAQVVRSAAHVGRRSDTRRRHRERVAARSEIADSTADIVARAAQLQLVVKALMELDEPYRSTLLLAYFDGLTSAEIANRMGISDVAVRKRASRGLARLRARLDAEHGGDRQAWVSAFAPWLGLGLVPEAKFGAVAVAKIAAVLAAAGAVSFFLPAPSGSSAGGDARQVAVVLPADPGSGEAERSTGNAASEAATPGHLGVRLVDQENGRPLEGVRIEIAAARGTRGAQLAATDHAGWARFRVPAGDVLVAVAHGSELASIDLELAIAPLAPGEARLVTLSLQTARTARSPGGRPFGREPGSRHHSHGDVEAETSLAERSARSFGAGASPSDRSEVLADHDAAQWTESGSGPVGPGSPGGGDPPGALDVLWGMGGVPGSGSGPGKIGDVEGRGPSDPMTAVGGWPPGGPQILGPGSSGATGGRSGGVATGPSGAPEDSQAAMAGPPGDGPTTSGSDAGLGPVAGAGAGGPDVGGPGDSTGPGDVAWIRIATIVPATYVVLSEGQVVVAGVLAPGEVVTQAVAPGLGEVRARVAGSAAIFVFAVPAGETATAAIAR